MILCRSRILGSPISPSRNASCSCRPRLVAVNSSDRNRDGSDSLPQVQAMARDGARRLPGQAETVLNGSESAEGLISRVPVAAAVKSYSDLDYLTVRQGSKGMVPPTPCHAMMVAYVPMQELLAIQQSDGPKAIGFFGTRNMGVTHQKLVEVLSYAYASTVRHAPPHQGEPGKCGYLLLPAPASDMAACPSGMRHSGGAPSPLLPSQAHALCAPPLHARLV
jgi:hypothetical protein